MIREGRTVGGKTAALAEDCGSVPITPILGRSLLLVTPLPRKLIQSSLLGHMHACGAYKFMQSHMCINSGSLTHIHTNISSKCVFESEKESVHLY